MSIAISVVPKIVNFRYYSQPSTPHSQSRCCAAFAHRFAMAFCSCKKQLKNNCQECKLDFGDETCKIILNTKGRSNTEVHGAWADFLPYVENSTDSFVDTLPPENTGIRRLHNRIKELKKSRTWEGHYMSFEESLPNSMNAGLKQSKFAA